MASDRTASRPGWLARAAPGLLLLTPFVTFVRHHAYVLYAPEILGSLLVFAAVGAIVSLLLRRWPLLAGVLTAGALILLVDLQFDVDVPIEGIGETAALLAAIVVLSVLLTWAGTGAASVVGLMASAALATTVLMPGGRLVTDESNTSGVRGDGPLILHLILDEHIGPAGLRAAERAEAADRLQQFLEAERFRVFSAAYSEYADTTQAIGHALDLVPGMFVESLVASAQEPFAGRLSRSRYFAKLTKRGYAIHVYQSDHMDLCHSSIPVASCHTYASTKLGVLQGTPLTWSQRATVVLGAYLMRSDLWTEAREFYNDVRERAGPTLPAWDWEQTRVSPIASAAALSRLERDLRSARRGQAIVSHLLLPHFPYVYDAECRTLPPSAWLERNDDRWFPARNTPEGRAVRYLLYIDQLACTQRWVGRLLRAIPDHIRRDAIVVLHGDHGSRITLNPQPPAPPRASDAVDVHSTLFAVRGPGVSPGEDKRQSAIPCLLAEFVGHDFKAAPSPEACDGGPMVQTRVEGRYRSRQLQRFSEERP
jgi:hypothetical protein